MTALWHSLAAEIERRGAAAILADVERIAERLDADIGAAFGLPAPVVAFDPQLGGVGPTSLIVRISNELRDAQASMHRAVIIAHTLAAMPSKEGACKSKS